MRDLVRSRRRKTKTEERAGGRVKRCGQTALREGQSARKTVARAGKRGNCGHGGRAEGPGRGACKAAGRPARRWGTEVRAAGQEILAVGGPGLFPIGRRAWAPAPG